MIINFNFLEQMVCELQIKLGDDKPVRGYEEQHFVYEILRSIDKRQPFYIVDTVTKWTMRLMAESKIDYDREISDKPIYHQAYPQSLQKILEDEGVDWKNVKP